MLPYCGEVIFQRREMLVRRWLQEERKFSHVNLKPVDLLMVQSETADDRVRVEELLPCGA